MDTDFLGNRRNTDSPFPGSFELPAGGTHELTVRPVEEGLAPACSARYTERVDPADRKRLLDMARRRAKPGSGSDLELVREGRAFYGASDEWPDLTPIKHVIVGGLATALYMPERMTLDTDVLISTAELVPAEALLERAGHERTGPRTCGGSSWRLQGGGSLDLIALDRPWVDEALASCVRDERGRPFVGLAYLVLMKLESGRLQDLADISRMLGYADDDQLDDTRAAIVHHRPADRDDLESMIALGNLEHQ